MKTNLSFIVACFILFINVNAQNTFPSGGAVGIGTTSPNASSLLEVKSTTKGILIPRMTLTQRNAIASPATGLLIYQTNSTPGFYYYSGTAWTAVTQKSKGWSLTGNSGTTSSNFLGTTDVQPLRFRVNNKNSGIIDYNLGTAAFGYLALNSNTATSNTAVGYEAGYANTSGASNTAIGSSALTTNTTGTQNTATGAFALYASTGSYNTANGYDALASNGGNYNIALGSLAGHTNTSGSTNIFIGYNAGNGSQTGSGNICIGQTASVSNGVSNSIVIGNLLSTSYSNAIILGSTFQNVGIGTTTPESGTQLTVNGGGEYGNSIHAKNINTSGYGVFGESLDSSMSYLGANVGVYGYAARAAQGAGEYGIYGNVGNIGFAGGFNGDIAVSGATYSGSDVMLTKNIVPLTNAITQLLKMPVKEFDFNKDYAQQNKLNVPAEHQFGFIAQDVMRVFPNLVKNVITPFFDNKNANVEKKSTNFLAINYVGFIPLLTKAVQELAAQNDSLKNQNINLNSKLNDLQSQINQLKAMFVSNQSTIYSQSSNTYLLQNVPNPFSNSTTINYTLPKHFSSAKIIVTDKLGKALKEINLASLNGSIIIDASTLSSGAFQYSLYVDGEKIDSKQMILTK